MKKVLYVCLCLSLSLMIGFIVMPLSAYATDVFLEPNTNPVYNFEITGGLSDKKVESTFETYRSITGTAEKDAVVTITVFFLNDEDEYEVSEQYEVIVGLSGVFSKDIELQIGENMIEIIAVKDHRLSMETAVINRKSMDIKLELESNNILLPGTLKAPKI